MEKSSSFRHFMSDPDPKYGLCRSHFVVHTRPWRDVEETRSIYDVCRRCIRVPDLDGLVIRHSTSFTDEKFKFRSQSLPTVSTRRRMGVRFFKIFFYDNKKRNVIFKKQKKSIYYRIPVVLSSCLCAFATHNHLEGDNPNFQYGKLQALVASTVLIVSFTGNTHIAKYLDSFEWSK